MTPPQMQDLAPTNDAQRAAAADRLKAARKSMIVSVGFSALLLVYLIWRISSNYSNPAMRGNNNILLVFGVVILARVGFSGYRLYNKWKELKSAQDHHRSVN